MVISPFICIWILWFNVEFSDDNIHDYIHKLHAADDVGASQSPENGQMGSLFSEYGIMITKYSAQNGEYKIQQSDCSKYRWFITKFKRWC